MKRGTPEHPKTEMLAMLLNIHPAQAIGHLELLWHFAARYAPAGDIGRWPDEIIASRCLWKGDPLTFIEALCHAKGQGKYGWVEPHKKYRLVIHDWHEHADESVKKWIVNHHETFWNGELPYQKRAGKNTDEFANDSETLRNASLSHARAAKPSQAI